jgi:leader peptidase (prepilin peptidase) / N-methyltransferase
MDRALLLVCAGVLGLVFGSFMSVVISRVPAGESVVAPRSRCPNCGTQIRSIDNVPVLSYLVLRGRCRSCGTSISPVYPLLELATGALFVGAALRFPRIGVAAAAAGFLWVLLAVSMIDLERHIIPNRIIYPAFVALAVAVAAGDALDWGLVLWRGAAGAGIYGGGLLLIAIISPRGMGMGDVKLAATIGLFLGSLSLARVGVAAGAGILLGGLGALVALAVGRSRKDPIPFGPFLSAGAALAVFAGPELARVYLRLVT